MTHESDPLFLCAGADVLMQSTSCDTYRPGVPPALGRVQHARRGNGCPRGSPHRRHLLPRDRVGREHYVLLVHLRCVRPCVHAVSIYLALLLYALYTYARPFALDELCIAFLSSVSLFLLFLLSCSSFLWA